MLSVFNSLKKVWSDSTNATLMQNVASKLGISVGGVPFYVVGDYYGNKGFPNPTSNAESYATMTQELKDAIKKAYTEANKKNSTYVDIVASVGTGNTSVNDETTTKTGNDIVGYILLGITIIIVVCIVFGRSYTKEDFEEVEEPVEVKEEVKEVEVKKAPAKKTEAKKTTAKKTTTKKSTAKKTTTKKTTKKNK